MEGLITDTQIKKRILDKFLEKFVKSDYTFKNQVTGGLMLIWCNFREDYKIYSTEELFQSPLIIDNPVYFYNERTQEMFFTDFTNVRNFIINLEPWDEVDAEIFDESLGWVIAVTHEDVSLANGLCIMIDEYDYEKDIAR